MIEVKKHDGYAVCNSCGNENNLTEITIRYRNGAGGQRICLCRKCSEEIIRKLSCGTGLKLRDYEDTGMTPDEILDGKMLTGWIPVDEQLPSEKYDRVIVCVEDGKVTTGRYSEFSKIWYIGDMCGVGGPSVIAWMPLPEHTNFKLLEERGECVKYKYFVSFAHEIGFGNAEVSSKTVIKSYGDIEVITKKIIELKKYKQIIILNFILLSSEN